MNTDQMYSDYNIFITKFILSPVKIRKNMINNICNLIGDDYSKTLLKSTNVYTVDNQPYNIYDSIIKLKMLNNEQVHKSFNLWVNKSL